jgi:hypothetical protein
LTLAARSALASSRSHRDFLVDPLPVLSDFLSNAQDLGLEFFGKWHLHPLAAGQHYDAIGRPDPEFLLNKADSRK